MDYIIDTKSPKDWQKVLNQWKHDYWIDIGVVTWKQIILYQFCKK